MWKLLVLSVHLLLQFVHCQKTPSVHSQFSGRKDFLSSHGQEVAEAVKHFPSRLYHAYLPANASSASDLNFVLSPFSLSSVLSMLREGAGGSTRDELEQVLNLHKVGDKDNAISKGYYDILFSLHENKGTQVQIANRIYITNAAKLNQKYLDLLKSSYLTSVLPTNFAKGEEVAQDMNNWVKTATNGKISKIVDSSTIEANVKAVVANVIYFVGNWTNEFSLKGTRQDLFYSDDGNRTTPANFMEQEDVFPHVDLPQLGASAVGMPYEGDRFSLIVLLPNKGTTLSQLEKKLQESVEGMEQLVEIPQKMSRKAVHLLFPKFRLESELDYVKSGTLQKLGLKKSITPGEADFSNIISDFKLHIDSILQKCYVDVTEHGTEAAAATFAKIVPFSIRRTVPFRVTKPFMAYIYDSVTKSILFIMRKSKA